MRQRIVVCRGSSESRVFALPLISGDLCSLTIAKALWIRHLTTILLLHFRETSRRINTEIVAIFRFSVSVLSPARTTTASRLPQSQQVDLNPRTIPHLGGLQTSLTPWQRLHKLFLVQEKGFFPPCFIGENLCRRIKWLAEGHKGGVSQHTQNFNHKTFHFTLVLLLRNRTKIQNPGIVLQSRCHPHHYTHKNVQIKLNLQAFESCKAKSLNFWNVQGQFYFYF